MTLEPAGGCRKSDKRKWNARKLLGTALCSALLLETAASSQVFAAEQPPDSPIGTLLLPMTPKLDVNPPAKSAFDTSSASGQDESTTASPSFEGPPPGSAPSSADPLTLKPAPKSISPERGSFEGNKSTDDDDVSDEKLMKGTVQIVADDTEYDEAHNTFLGTGNAQAIIAGQDSKLEADSILYDQNDQVLDARGNVRIIRNNNLTTGSAFRFKVTSDQYLITDPDTEVGDTTVIARKAVGYKGSMTFKNGTATSPKPFWMGRNSGFAPLSYREGLAEINQHPEAFVPPNGSYKFRARKMVYERYKETNNLTVFGGQLQFGNFNVPVPKFVCTVNSGVNANGFYFPTFGEVSNNLQSGGLAVGPTFTNPLLNGLLTWKPMVQIGGKSVYGPTSSPIGLAGQIAFSSPRVTAHLGYGTVSNMGVADFKWLARKGFKFQAGMNRYLDDGMFGTRRARFLLEAVDNHSVGGIPFLAGLNFRSSAGWAQDDPRLLNQYTSYGALFGSAANSTKITSAFRLQEQITASSQPIFSLGDSRWGVKSYIYGGTALRGYSTGDKMLLGQIGPVLDAYLGRVRLQTGYTQSAVRGSTPFTFDQFVQGTRSIYVNGDIRIAKYVTIGGSIGYNLVDKLYYGKMVTAAFGPPDFKLLLSRDMVRGTNRFGFNVLYGQPVPFDKLVLKGNADQGQLGGI